MRYLTSLFLAFSALALASAQDVFTGTVEVAFGHMKMPDGTVRSLKGLKLPYRAERVQAVEVSRGNPLMRLIASDKFKTRSLKSGGADALQAIYQADHGVAFPNEPYAIVGDFSSASVLDDINCLPNGVNRPWRQLTFGYDTLIANPIFLIRWTMFDRYTAGRGENVSAVDPWPISPTYPLDFGVIWNRPSAVGTFKVTIDVSSANVYAPAQNFWIASQFRQVTFPVNPDAPFDERIRNVFSTFTQPQIGTSSEFYWLDSQPDGLYDETEQDIFGDSQNPLAGNLLLKMEADVAGTLVTVNPNSAVTASGNYVSGDNVSLHFENDSDTYFARPNYFVSRTQPPLSIEMTGRSPVATINGISINVRARTVSGNGTIKLEMFRYSGTPGWVQVYSGPITNAFQSILYTWTQGNPSQFVDPSTRNVRMRALLQPGLVSRSFGLDLDLANWTINRP